MSSRCTWSPVGKIRNFFFTRSCFAWLTQNSPLNVEGYWKGCGGTILDKETILSAAHCFEHGYDIVYAEVGFKYHGTPPEKLNVSSVEMHPEYNPQNADNDLSVLKLTFPLIWTKMSSLLAYQMPLLHLMVIWVSLVVGVSLNMVSEALHGFWSLYRLQMTGFLGKIYI